MMNRSAETVKTPNTKSNSIPESSNTPKLMSERDSSKSVCLVFSPPVEEVGIWGRYLKIFEAHGVRLLHTESRPSTRANTKYDYVVECPSGGGIDCAITDIRRISEYVIVTIRTRRDNENMIPWFPRHISDLDCFPHQILSYGAELDSDHPGFTDPVYRARRKYFADIAYNYRYSQSLPRINYTQEETETWGKVFRHITTLHPTHACEEYNHAFALMVQTCGYSVDHIPQIEDISNFLKTRTGFSLRPVAGLLSNRDYLAGLALRVFPAVQYIRHASQPYYTPEPDVCHELLGHLPLFADRAFAEFCQQIGLASLGAPDDYISKLEKCFWFTVELGLCSEKGQLKAFGAGLLSSYGELEYCLSDRPETRPFEPTEAAVQNYPITNYQPIYYVSESFEDSKNKISKYASTIPRPFRVRYNATTQSIEVLDSEQKIEGTMLKK